MLHGHGALWSGFLMVQAPISASHPGGTQGDVKAGTSLQAVSAGGCLADPLLYVSHSFKLKMF